MDALTPKQSAFLLNELHLSANLVLIYDHVLTFSAEVEHFWGTPLTFGNALFFANRYFTLFVIIVSWAIRTVTVTSDCGRFLAIRELSLILTQGFVMAILFLRTYALYNRSKTITFVLAFAAFVQTAVNLIALLGFRQSITGTIDPSSQGCQVVMTAGTARRIAVPWMSVLGIDVLIFGLTLARTWRIGSGDGLAKIVRRDGTLYFGVMVLANLVNILAYWIFPLALKDSMSQFASYLSVTMASRLCLNIQRSPPPPEFTSVLPSLGAISESQSRTGGKLGPRPLTWGSDLTVSANFGNDDDRTTKKSDMESVFARSEESVLHSPEVAEWRIYAKGMSVH